MTAIEKRKNRAAAAIVPRYPLPMTDALPPLAAPLDPIDRLQAQSADYHRMEGALAWLAERWRERPLLDDAAAAVDLSPFHFQRIFTRWAGVSPKTFMAAIAHAEARRLLEDGDNVLNAAFDAGFSGPSRLHDLFIAQEALTPGEAKKRGEGVALTWGFAPTPFGNGLFVETPRGLCGLAFTEAGEDDIAYKDMRRRWPAAAWTRSDAHARETAAKVFGGPNTANGGVEVPLVLMGPPFQVQIWKALLRIPAGRTATYSQVATWAGSPGAFRAAGAAIGANPISLLIPCHRAIAKDGRLTGYHWGLARKAAMLGSEAVAAYGREMAA